MMRVVRSFEAVVTALRRAVTLEVENVNRFVSHALRAGLVLSVAFSLGGLLWAIASGTPLAESTEPLSRVLADVLRLEPSGFLNLGVLVLLATPAARVIVAMASFVRTREARFAFIASIVLLNLTIALSLAAA